MILYELWDERTRRAVGRWTTEAEALAAVRDLLDRGEVLTVSALILRSAGWEGTATVAAGSELAQRARQPASKWPDRRSS